MRFLSLSLLIMTSKDAPDGYAVLIEREAPASKRQLRGGSSMSLGN